MIPQLTWKGGFRELFMQTRMFTDFPQFNVLYQLNKVVLVPGSDPGYGGFLWLSCSDWL